MRLFRFSLLFTALLLAFSSFSQSISQWRGPHRDGHYPDKNLLSSWPAEGPNMVWSVEGIGKGYSTAVSDGKNIYITGKSGNDDELTAISKEGKILWQVPYGPAWSGSFPESRCTPTVENGKAYVVSGSGTIACINTSDGKIVWSFDGLEKFKGAYGDWGVCESLLLSGNKLIYTPAGPATTMVALNKETGETTWASETLNDTSAYVSPLLVEFAGKKIIVTIINKYLVGVEESSGKILWKYDYSSLKSDKSLQIWPGAPKTNTITPLFKDGELYITGGYNHDGAKFRISPDASSIELLWTDSTLDCHMGGVVLQNGYIYGSNWFNNSMGDWCCLDWKTGKTLYEKNWFTKGAVIEADGKLYCFEEKSGNVALVNPTPEKFDLISSFKTSMGTGPAWAHPSIYDGLLLVRRGDALMAFDIRQK
ncbi:MAG: PQQ-like beta-propeller repeat protein [Bacteroidetes bacterium]|nr:PQQ-like beta-propeller repeat protein [Bacteroidota bacterium]